VADLWGVIRCQPRSRQADHAPGGGHDLIQTPWSSDDVITTEETKENLRRKVERSIRYRHRPSLALIVQPCDGTQTALRTANCHFTQTIARLEA